VRDIYLSCFNTKEREARIGQGWRRADKSNCLERNTAEFTGRKKCRKVRVGINL
jgi:hypothetical protein